MSKKWLGGALLLLCFFINHVLGTAWSEPSFISTGRVIKVYDGDTLELENGTVVRYLGIDTPEIQHGDEPGDCYGQESLARNRELVLMKKVSLKYDEEKVDHYGRMLAYVYTEDGTFVNELLLREGYAFVLRTSAEGFHKLSLFLKAQAEALKTGKGLWRHCHYKREVFYKANTRSFVFHRPNCPWARQISPSNQGRFNTREEAFLEGFHPCRKCKP